MQGTHYNGPLMIILPIIQWMLKYFSKANACSWNPDELNILHYNEHLHIFFCVQLQGNQTAEFYLWGKKGKNNKKSKHIVFKEDNKFHTAAVSQIWKSYFMPRSLHMKLLAALSKPSTSCTKKQ